MPAINSKTAADHVYAFDIAMIVSGGPGNQRSAEAEQVPLAALDTLGATCSDVFGGSLRRKGRKEGMGALRPDSARCCANTFPVGWRPQISIASPVSGRELQCFTPHQQHLKG